MWNGFTMIRKRPELTEGMMQTLVEAERTLLESPGNTTHHTPGPGTVRSATGQSTSPVNINLSLLCGYIMIRVVIMVAISSSTENEYSVDDRCVIHLLMGLCLKNQGKIQAAEDCFNKVYSR